jgi:hypothetical protein
MSTFFIKRNDTSPIFRAILKDGDGVVVDVTGATVRFHMVDQARVLKVDAAAVINAGSSGDVQYEWIAADTDTAGFFDAEFEVTFATSRVETFPNNSFQRVHIYEDLA